MASQVCFETSQKKFNLFIQYLVVYKAKLMVIWLWAFMISLAMCRDC